MLMGKIYPCFHRVLPTDRLPLNVCYPQYLYLYVYRGSDLGLGVPHIAHSLDASITFLDGRQSVVWVGCKASEVSLLAKTENMLYVVKS